MLKEFLEGNLDGKVLLEQDISRGIRATEDLAENIKNLYEVDWKLYVVNYNIKDRGGVGPAVKRFRNIKDRLERKGRKVVDKTAEMLLDVFENWLSKHALLDADEWTENWINEAQQMYGLGMDYVTELYRFFDGLVPSGFETSVGRAFENFIKEQGWNRNIELNLQEEQAYLEPEEPLYEMIGEALDQKELTDTLIGHYREVIVDAHGGAGPVPMGYALDSFFVRDPKDFWEFYLKNEVFPLWKDYWVNRGIRQTREQVEKATEGLRSAFSEPIQEAFGDINFAINVSHQTGPVLDYIIERYPELDPQLLSDLSDGEFLDEWRQDIVDARMSLPPSPENPDLG